jgi:predicted dehydrogenase
MDRTFEPTFSLRWQKGSSVEEVPIPKAAGEVFELVDQFARFVQAVEAGGRPAASGEDGRWSVLLCEKAQESITKGMPVSL